MGAQELLWIDLETTGFDPERCWIIEVAAVATSRDLIEGEWLEAVIRPPDDVMRAIVDGVPCESVDGSAGRLHRENGLAGALVDGGNPLQVERRLRELIARNFPDSQPMLAGSSVHFDRDFLRFHMPDMERMLHYRNFDVSTLRTAARWWAPEPGDEMQRLRENVPHRATGDLLATIEATRVFRHHLIGVHTDSSGTR